jgi:hypothetical protein
MSSQVWCSIATSSEKKRSAEARRCSASARLPSGASTEPSAADAFAPSQLRLVPIRPTAAFAFSAWSRGDQPSALERDEDERRAGDHQAHGRALFFADERGAGRGGADLEQPAIERHVPPLP